MKTRNLVTTLLTATALCAAPVVSLSTAQAAPQPVQPEIETAALPDDRPATTSLEVPEGTTMMGVSWVPTAGSDAPDAPQVQVRAERDGEWGAWVDVSPNDDGPDPDSAEYAQAEAAGGVRATDPVDVDGADKVEVRTSQVEGVHDVEAAMVDPGESPADELAGAPEAGTPVASADAAVGKPSVMTRAQWGADESLRSCTPSKQSTIKAIVVHHTADGNSYTNGPAMMRSIYAYHTKVNKWCDVGYNALVDRWGQVYEGRYGGLESNVVGAHSGGFNTATWGVSVIGNFEVAALPAAAKASVERLVAWKAAQQRLNPTGTTSLTSSGSTKYAAGRVVTVPVIVGHRDVSLTACPGIDFYGKLGSVRAAVKSLITPTAAPAPAPVRKVANPAAAKRLSDFTADGRADVLARTAAGDLLLYAGNGKAGWSAGRRIGSGWASYTLLTAAGDVNGDKTSDLYARDSSGRLWLYPRNAGGGWKSRVQVGDSSWKTMTALVAVTDMSGDGRVDLVARDKSGLLFLYPTTAKGTLDKRRHIGNGWQNMTTILGPGDFDGDGRADILARTADGRMMLYPGTASGGLGSGRQVGHGWKGFTAVLAVGNLDGRGGTDLLTRDSGGRLRLYPTDGRGNWLGSRQVGHGWKAFTAIV